MTTIKFSYDSTDQLVAVYGMPGALETRIPNLDAATAVLQRLGYQQTDQWQPSGGEGMYVTQAQG